MELTVNNFQDLQHLIHAKDNAVSDYRERELRETIVRGFYNGKPIMTEADADAEAIENITNHLIGYANIQIFETKLYALWSTSNKIVDIDVHEGDAEKTERESGLITKYLNKAIYRSNRFGSFWRSVAGEIAISGRAACIHNEDYDWCPTVQPKLLLPDSVGSDASEFTYAFVPKELTIEETSISPFEIQKAELIYLHEYQIQNLGF